MSREVPLANRLCPVDRQNIRFNVQEVTNNAVAKSIEGGSCLSGFSRRDTLIDPALKKCIDSHPLQET